MLRLFGIDLERAEIWSMLLKIALRVATQWRGIVLGLIPRECGEAYFEILKKKDPREYILGFLDIKKKDPLPCIQIPLLYESICKVTVRDLDRLNHCG